MKRNLLWVLLFLGCIPVFVDAQPPGPCPGSTAPVAPFCSQTCTLCGQGIDGYVGMNANTPQWEAPPDFCAPQFHSVQWLAFVAGSTNITFQFSVSDCDDGNGLQVGIYGTTDCASWTSVSNCDPAVPENASTILNASGLVPGGTYLFVIDGNVGDVCQFQIDVLSGSTVAPPVTGTPSIIGPTNVCTGGTSTYTVAGVNGAGYYTWTLNGNPIGFDQTVDVTFPANGTYQLCVTPGNSCFGDGPTVCTNITVGPLPPELITDDICPEDLPYEYQDFTFSQSGTYNFEYTRPDGCIQPVVLNLTVNEPTPDSEFTVNICTGEAYIWQGLTYSQTGFYPRTFQDGNGCDYVITLELIVNPPDLEPLGEIYWCSLFGPYYVGNVPLTQSGDFSITLDNQFGCDSTVFGFLYITSPEFVFIDTIICPGEEVTIGDFSYTQTGNYQETYIEPGGCENFFQLQLLVYDPETFLDRTICSGESVTIGNSTYSTTGVYQKVLTSYLGCDSTVHLNLTVLPPITNSISAEICAGESYTFGSNTYTTAGTYSQVFPSANDCDSTVTLTLTVNPDVQTTLNRSVCFGESFTVGTSTFTQTGAYQVDLTSADGCDSTVFLNLTVKPEIITNLNPTICEGEVFSAGNMPFTDEGTYSITLTANDGCDSTVNINLTVLEHVETLLNASICLGQSYTVGTSTFNTTGNYTVVLNAANGCDSTVMLSLNVLGPIEETLDVAICTGQTYTVGNSTYSVPGFYTDILTNDIGCDSIVYLNLSIQDVLRDTLVLSLCEGESYPIGSNNYNSTGFYSGAFVTASGCDSVFYLDLTILPTRYTDLNITICEGESVMVGNSTYTSTGSYQNILTSVETNCDSIVSLQLTVNDVPETFLTRSICEGESFIVGSSTYTQTGSYLDVLAAANGCDSLVHLELTVLDVPETFLVENICDGTVFTVGNSTYATSGTYTNTLTAANGCDSIVHLDLTVLSIPETSLMVEICELESFSVGSSVYDQSGSYTDILSASSGCDSIVYLELVVYPIKERLLNISICDGGSYTVGGTNYTMAGTYVDTLVSANNCDSIVTLNLSVTDFYEINLLETICEGDAFSVGSNTYTSSGFYSNMFISSDGCDSIVNLDLTVLPIPRTTLDRVICDGESVSVGGTPYTNTGTYIDTLTAIETGCDSIVTLNLVVNEIYDVVLDEVICDGESFAVGSSSYNNTGTYVNVLTSSSGCDSTVTLNLTVNDIRQTSLSQTLCFGSSFSVGNSTYSNTGIFRDTLLSVETNCDSIVTLNLTILPQIITTISPTICFGDSFSVGNSTYSSSGAYADTLIAANGCDSVVALNLTVRDEIVSTLVEEICDGDQFTVGNSNYSNSGQYADTLLSVLTGCDSIVTLNLTVHPIPQTTLVEEICDGESFGVGNSDYTVSGQFVDTLTSLVTGCDSIVTLNLTVHPIPQTTLVAEICDGESFGVGTSSYTISGQFVDTLTSLVTGCDSIVTLQLTVKAILQTTLVEEICDGESFGVGNSAYTVSGQFVDTLTSVVTGCDSVVTLNLTVHPIPQTTLVEEICDGESFGVGNSDYTVSGQFVDTLTSVVTGCDSVVTLNLTVHPIPQTTLVEEICDGESFGVGNSAYTVSGQFVDTLTSVVTGCDSVVMLNLTVNPVYDIVLNEVICEGDAFPVGNNSFSQTGTYTTLLQSAEGCDSTVTLNLTTYPCTLLFALAEVDASCFNASDGQATFSLLQGTPPYQYSWQSLSNPGLNGTGVIEGNNIEALIANIPAGAYEIEITDSSPFAVTTTISFTLDQPDLIDLSLLPSEFNSYNVSCDGAADGIIFTTVEGGTPNYQYYWSDGSQVENLDDLGAGYYSLTVSDLNTCLDSADLVLIAPAPMVSQIATVDPPCFGQEAGLVNIEAVVGGVGPYQFSINGQAFGSTGIFSNLGIGYHTVTIMDVNGCILQEEVEIIEPDELWVELGDDDEIALGDSIRLFAQTSYDVAFYNWNTPVGRSCDNCPDPYIRPFETINVFIEVIDSNGCVARDDQTIFVDRSKEVYIPNVFSPNGDGSNDEFLIFAGPDVVNIKSFYVFNRWGESMYEIFNFVPNDPFYGWDGTHRGELMNGGVYVYMAEIEFIDGTVVFYKGDILLMR